MKLLNYICVGLAAAGTRQRYWNRKHGQSIRQAGMTIQASADFESGTGGVSGSVVFVEDAKGDGVQLTGLLRGLPDGTLGWHIHMFGRAELGCGPEFTGPHFNPYTAPLGDKHMSVKKREVAQIGNVVCKKGSCVIQDIDQLIRLYGYRGIVGRSLVIHENADGGVTGGSGARIACANIVFGVNDGFSGGEDPPKDWYTTDKHGKFVKK